VIAAALTLIAWALTLSARLVNARGNPALARLCLILAGATGVLAGLALFVGPWSTGLDPTTHSYPAIVWTLAIWVMAHLATGLLMQGYCFARSLYGKMTPRYDADLWNVTLYWHFTAFMGVVTCLVIGFFPGLT
jgi:heme/copper-type cytochrome/quinol oxidase subunit 3